MRVEIYNYVSQIELELLDNWGDFFGQIDKQLIFQVEEGPFRLYDFDDNVQLAITFELNRDLLRIRRQVFNLLDLLGAVGGLAGALKALFAAGIIIFQYKASINYVSNHTYQVRENEDHERKEGQIQQTKDEENLKQIKIGFFTSIKHSFQRLFPCCFCKSCHSRKDRLVLAADEMVKDELKIVRWVQFMRVTELAMRKLFSKDELKQIHDDAKYRVVAFSEENDEDVVLIKGGFELETMQTQIAVKPKADSSRVAATSPNVAGQNGNVVDQIMQDFEFQEGNSVEPK